jgi:hypothetical protein
MLLSVYVGLRAIGFILSERDRVIHYGIKRVGISFRDYQEYLSGMAVSKRVLRRLYRQMRRNRSRYRSRRDRLLRIIRKHLGCEPQYLPREESLRLRVRALSERLSNVELATVLMSLQRRRGYLARRGGDRDSEYVRSIEEHERAAAGYPSIAAYLLTLPSGRHVVFYRSSHEREFNMIMDCQQVDDRLRRLLLRTIFFQRSVRHKPLRYCPCERNRKVCHASHPLYQQLRLWRDVRNIHLMDKNGSEVEIPEEIRQRWYERLLSGRNLTKAACLKDLGIGKASEYSWLSGKHIAGHALARALGDSKVEMEKLWYDMFSCSDDDRLFRLLTTKYNLQPTTARRLIDLDLMGMGWADFSLKAVRKLLPLLQRGMTLKEALLEAYSRVDFSRLVLPNVVLQQHFESYRSLISQLQKEWLIDRIRFEIDPLLKMGNQARRQRAASLRRDEKLRAQHPDLSDYQLAKLKLWQQDGGICPYQPGRKISMRQAVSDSYTIDHIVPKSLLFEHGTINQVLCPKHLNRQKDRLTGMEMARRLGIMDDYLKAVEQLPESKRPFLLMERDQIPRNYISQLQLSGHNTRCFATVGQNVVNIPNKLIIFFQRRWNLMEYGEDDARHYLCRAWVLANLSQQTVEYFDSIMEHSQDDNGVSVYDLQPSLQMIDFKNAPVFMPRVKFSRHTPFGYTPRFPLHEESIYGRRVIRYRDSSGKLNEKVFYKIRYPVARLTERMVRNILDRELREKILERIRQHGSHQKGIESLVDDPVIHCGHAVRSVSVAINATKVFPLHSTDDSGRTCPLSHHEHKIDYVFSVKNYCVRIDRDDKGRLKIDTISLYDYIRALNSGERIRKGFCLFENDIILYRSSLWYLIGASGQLTLRPVYRLTAADTVKLRRSEITGIKKVEISQTGKVKRIYGIEDCLPAEAATTD